jgi:hypothetical protein
VMLKNVVAALPHQLVARVAKPDHLLDLRIESDQSGAKKFGVSRPPINWTVFYFGEAGNK